MLAEHSLLQKAGGGYSQSWKVSKAFSGFGWNHLAVRKYKRTNLGATVDMNKVSSRQLGLHQSPKWGDPLSHTDPEEDQLRAGVLARSALGI